MNKALNLALIVAVALVLSASATAQTPVINSLTPSSVLAGSPQFDLIVNGVGFQPDGGATGYFVGSKVYWRPAAAQQPIQLPTTFMSTTQLVATVSADLVATAGTVDVWVTTVSLEADSNIVTFTITENPLSITTASPLQYGTVGLNYLVSFKASGGTPPYTWFLVGGTLPPGLNLATDGALIGVPTQAGGYQFTVSVVDAAQSTEQKSYLLNIRPALAITTPSPLPDAATGTDYFFAFTAVGGTQPYLWQVTDGNLPPGLALSGDGRITGVPTQTGAYDFQVTVTDYVQSTAAQTYHLAVTAGVTITTRSPLPDGTVGVAYSQPLAASGGTPPYQWSLVDTSLPPGLSLSPAGVVSGTPTQAGGYLFTVRVRDQRQAATVKQFAITINPGGAVLRITTQSPLPAGNVGSAYSQTLAATGGSPPYSWQRIEGALPPGLTLAANGTISGTPTRAGAYTFQVRVTDSAEGVDEKVFQLTINQPALAIVTSSLPAATLGATYSPFALQATGGAPPYTWSVTGGALPGGMAMSAEGVLSGTPAAAGTYNFQARVADVAGGSASRSFTLNVGLPAITGVSFPGLPGQSDPARQLGLAVNLAAPYPLPLTGQATLTFTPDAVVPVDDPAVQFSTGGRSVNFSVPSGQTEAGFPAGDIAVQTGSVAGTITVSVRLWAGSQEVTPSPAPSRQIQIARAAPLITSVQVVRTGSGFEVHVIGLSTPREVTQATFHFTASPQANLQTTQVTPTQVGQAFSTWYQSASSAAFGSAFEYVQPFTINGDSNAVASVSVTLTNSQGTSQSASAQF